MKPIQLAILGSTRGTNLIPIVEAIRTKTLAAEIAVVVSNKEQAGILDKAKNFNLAAQALPIKTKETRTAYDQRLLTLLQNYRVDLIVLIGYMRILSPQFIQAFNGRIINVHPSLLPKHQGLMDLAVHQAVLSAHELESGCSVHFVTDIVDGGEVIVQKRCKVLATDTPELLKQRVQALEGSALIEAITLIHNRSKDEPRKT
jgi:phosphoribosylglycinamide formyltransferase-1